MIRARASRSAHFFLAWVCGALLAGCAALPPEREQAPARPKRAEIGAYAVTGRIVVRHANERHNADIEWQHAAAADEILLTGPLGQGIAQLTRDARGARLVTADKQVVAAADWEELSQRVFGFALPLAGLPRWLVGDVPATARDAHGRPLAARAAGWDIRYLEYESDLAQALPVQIELRREEAELRLRIESWQID